MHPSATASPALRRHPSPCGTRRHILGIAAALGGLASLTLAGCGFGTGNMQAGNYRTMAARHLYQRYASQVYQGKMPPMVHAIGSVEVSLTAGGQVTAVRWLRAPRHAPEAMRAIEAMVRNASPFPAPGVATRYVDTWLWDQSGRFQLLTLTEGQYDSYDTPR